MFKPSLFTVLLLLCGPALGQTPAPAKKVPALAETPAFQELLKERLATLKEVVAAEKQVYQTGQGSFEAVVRAQLEYLEVELELCQTKKERVAALSRSLEAMKEYEKQVDARFQAGVGTVTSTLRAKAGRLKIQVELERAKAAP